jgi:ABC-type antimicrobial peptide transport system permease subunit
MALGAKRTDVLRLIVRKGMQLAAAGLLLGLVAILLLGRALSSLLYQVSLFNLPTLFLTSLILGATVLLACYLPARRAAGLDPMRTLRED